MEKSGEAREENGKSKTEKLIETDLSKKQKTETRSTSQPQEQTKAPFPIMFKSIRPDQRGNQRPYRDSARADHFTLFPFSNSRGYPSFTFEPDSRSMREIALFTIPCSFQLSLAIPKVTVVLSICRAGRSWKKGSGEPFRCKRDVLPPVRGDVFDRAGADLCPNLTTRCHMNRIKSPQADSGTMATN